MQKKKKLFYYASSFSFIYKVVWLKPLAKGTHNQNYITNNIEDHRKTLENKIAYENIIIDPTVT